MILPLLLAAAISVPAEVHENMLFLEVRVNGGPPRTFLLDTAVPSTMLDPRIHAKPAKLDIGGLPFTVDDPATIDLAFFEPLEGMRLDGILGMDLFRKYAVEMDFDAGLARFHDAETYRYDGVGEVLPVVVVNGKPHLDAKLKMPGKEELTRRYVIDTGSGGAISDELFAELAAKDGPPIGPDLGRAEYVELGPFRFAGANGTSGGMKIGGELLKRFHLIADFTRSRIILEPSRHFADQLLFDTSGVEVEQTTSGLRVVAVYPRTPAADAELKPGDVITHIDAQPALSLGMKRVRRMFHHVRTHELTVARGEQRLNVGLALRPLLPHVGRTTVATTSANGMPILQVRVHGKPLWFVIDTGSAYNLLDSAAAARLGIKATGKATVRGAGGGEVQTDVVDRLTFDINGLRSTLEARITDLSALEQHFGRRIDGFFGWELLAQHVVTFEPGRLIFGEYDHRGRGTVLPITFGGRTNRWIYVPATIKVAGQPPVEAQFFVDSGSLDGANHPVIRKATSPLRSIGTGRGLGSAGAEGGVAGTAEWIQLGPHRIENVSSSCCGPLPGTEAQVGQGVLEHFIVTYDYARKEMTVSPIYRK